MHPAENVDKGLKYWLVTILLLTIPLVNLYFIVYWAFIEKDEPRKSFTRAYSIIIGSYILLAVFLGGLGVALSLSTDSTQYGDYEYYTYEEDYQGNPEDIVIQRISTGIDMFEHEVYIDVLIKTENEVNEIHYRVDYLNSNGVIFYSTESIDKGPFLPSNTYQLTTEIDIIVNGFKYEDVSEVNVTILGYN